jgi:rhamnosyltransferase
LNLVWENLIRTVDHCDYIHALGLTYTLPEDSLVVNHVSDQAPLRVALCMHLYFEDLIAESVQLAANMPPDADIYVVTPKASLVEQLEAEFASWPNRVEVRLIENRGRDVAGLLIGCHDIQDRYDLVCFYHEKKSDYLEPHSVGKSLGFMTARNTLASRRFVQNVVDVFAQNSRLGMLCPPEPNNGTSVGVIGNEWIANYANVRQLAVKLGLAGPMSKAKPPVAPLGGCFWYRPVALKKLFDYNWTYEDFPKEPPKLDGTVLHAIERLYPYIVQDAGFFSGLLMSDKAAAIEYENLHHYVRNMTQALADNDMLRGGHFPTGIELRWMVVWVESTSHALRYALWRLAGSLRATRPYVVASSIYDRFRAALR